MNKSRLIYKSRGKTMRVTSVFPKWDFSDKLPTASESENAIEDTYCDYPVVKEEDIILCKQTLLLFVIQFSFCWEYSPIMRVVPIRWK